MNEPIYTDTCPHCRRYLVGVEAFITSHKRGDCLEKPAKPQPKEKA